MACSAGGSACVAMEGGRAGGALLVMMSRLERRDGSVSEVGELVLGMDW